MSSSTWGWAHTWYWNYAAYLTELVFVTYTGTEQKYLYLYVLAPRQYADLTRR